jgi:prepilin-type N-terminal cleavage/methylation domain-containing protein
MVRPKPGFTLVELLVVIAIIGVLVALLMPAVQSARESARRVHCMNNLRQVGLAVHNYHDVFQMLPTTIAAGLMRSNDDDFEVSHTWITQLYPFLEETALAAMLDEARQARSRTLLRQVAQSPVEVFYCPSRRQPIAYPLDDLSRTRYGDAGARTDYALNGGASQREGVIQIRYPGMWDREGSAIALEDITDGTSKTYYAGEKSMDARHYDTGRDEGDLAPTLSCRRGSCVRFAFRAPRHDVSRNQNCFNCHDFGSAHPATWNALYCDASVHPLSYVMEFEAHRAMTTPANAD